MRSAPAGLNDRPDAQADEPANDRAENCDDQKLTPDSTAQVTDRKEPQRDDERFKAGREDGTNRTRDYSDKHVAQPQIHC
jgi:hypothetical protein